MALHIQGTLACIICSVIIMLACSPKVHSFFTEKEETKKYVAQVKVFLDYSAKQHWKTETRKRTDSELRADMEIVFGQMNQIFRGLENYGLNLQLKLKDVVTVKYYDMILKSANDYKVSANSAVYDFQKWIASRYHKQDFDFAILFTGNDIYTTSYLTYGVAFNVGVMCSDKGVGVVEMFGKLPKETDGKLSNVARYTAHEMGHIFGAKHNDDEPLCKESKGYLMAAYAKIKGPNIYNITECTYKSINDKINELNERGNNCLLPSDSGTTEADVACQQREGSYDWYMSRSYKEYGDKMCENLICIKYDKETKQRVFTKGKAAPDGLGCGKSKSCKQGKCVADANGDPDLPDECPWGNQDLRKIGYSTSCEGQNCNSGWKTYCCAHCSAFYKQQMESQG